MAESKAENNAVGGTNVKWDDSRMESVYSNIATATANREEFFLLFGTHQNWRGVRPAEGQPLEVALSKRMILNPHAAKRLALILSQSVKVYEDQFGQIDI